MDISKLSEEGIKAAIYDQIVIAETTQKNIQILNAELAKRKGEPKDEVSDKKE